MYHDFVDTLYINLHYNWATFYILDKPRLRELQEGRGWSLLTSNVCITIMHPSRHYVSDRWHCGVDGRSGGISIRIKAPEGMGPDRLHSYSTVMARAYLVRPRSLAHSGGSGPETNKHIRIRVEILDRGVFIAVRTLGQSIPGNN